MEIRKTMHGSWGFLARREATPDDLNPHRRHFQKNNNQDPIFRESSMYRYKESYSKYEATALGQIYWKG